MVHIDPIEATKLLTADANSLFTTLGFTEKNIDQIMTEADRLFPMIGNYDLEFAKASQKANIKLGHEALKANYGEDCFKVLSKLGTEALKAKHGEDCFKVIGKLGIEALKAKHGDNYTNAKPKFVKNQKSILEAFQKNPDKNPIWELTCTKCKGVRIFKQTAAPIHRRNFTCDCYKNDQNKKGQMKVGKMGEYFTYREIKEKDYQLSL